MHPLNWFSWRYRRVRLVRLPNSGGSSPLNWFSWRSSPVTRPLAAVVTPSHSPIGASLSQLRLYPVFAIRGVVEGDQRFSVRFGRGLRQLGHGRGRGHWRWHGRGRWRWREGRHGRGRWRRCEGRQGRGRCSRWGIRQGRSTCRCGRLFLSGGSGC